MEGWGRSRFCFQRPGWRCSRFQMLKRGQNKSRSYQKLLTSFSQLEVFFFFRFWQCVFIKAWRVSLTTHWSFWTLMVYQSWHALIDKHVAQKKKAKFPSECWVKEPLRRFLSCVGQRTITTVSQYLLQHQWSHIMPVLLVTTHQTALKVTCQSNTKTASPLLKRSPVS